MLTLVKQIVYGESSDFVSLNRLCVPSVGVWVCVCVCQDITYNCSVIVGRREEKDGWWISWKLSSFLTLFEIILIWGVLARNKRSLLFWHHLSCCIIMCHNICWRLGSVGLYDVVRLDQAFIFYKITSLRTYL